MNELVFQTELGKLYYGDAWILLRQIKFNSIDLIILDPPYIELRDSRTNNNWNLNKKWYTLYRSLSYILKRNGYLFHFGLSTFFMVYSREILSNFKLYFDLIWVKPLGLSFINAKRRPLNRHEIIIALRKKDSNITDITYNYRDIGTYNKPYSIKRGKTGFSYTGQEPYDYITNHSDGFRYPTTILQFPSKPQMPVEERTSHPTQKPLGLIEWIVKGFSNKGDLILDPFIGSGTTAVACEKLDRQWIGIEIDDQWIPVIKERIRKIMIGKANRLDNFLVNTMEMRKNEV